jgi:hypothetical protein
MVTFFALSEGVEVRGSIWCRQKQPQHAATFVLSECGVRGARLS